MAKAKEKKVLVKASISPDDYLKLEILVRRTDFPMWWHIRKAIEEYTADVSAIPDSIRPPTTGVGS